MEQIEEKDKRARKVRMMVKNSLMTIPFTGSWPRWGDNETWKRLVL